MVRLLNNMADDSEGGMQRGKQGRDKPNKGKGGQRDNAQLARWGPASGSCFFIGFNTLGRKKGEW